MSVNFTEEQKAIIKSTADQIRVIAGPGSGKTTTLIARIVELLERGVLPENIFTICFAKHDKHNIVKKLYQNVDPMEVSKIRIHNYHSYGLNLIRQYGLYNKSGEEIKLLKESESHALIKTLLHQLYLHDIKDEERANLMLAVAKKCGISDSIFTLFDQIRDDFCIELINLGEHLNNKELREKIITFIEKFNEECSFLQKQEDYIKVYGRKALDLENFVSISELYGEFCQKHGYVDFMDMILQAYLILERNPEVLNQISESIHFLLVDEFQDISSLQFKMVSLLCKRHDRIFAVGDIDQCVYEWRNAKPVFMKDELPKRFSKLVTLSLSTNFRSDSNIVKVANNLIQNNKERLPFSMTPFHPAQNKVDLKYADSVFDQADAIANKVSSILMVRSQYYTEGDFKIAIIVRSLRSVSSNLIRNGLMKRGIPVKLRVESAHLEQIMSFVCSLLNLIIDPNSPADLGSVIEAFPGFGDKTVQKIKDYLNNNNSINSFLSSKLVPQSKMEKIKDFYSFLKDLNQTYRSNPDIQIKDLNLFTHSFDLTSLMKAYFMQGKGLTENSTTIDVTIEELKNNPEKFCDYRDTLTSGLSSLNESENGKKPAVILCTAHQAKGCEWESVICPDLVLSKGGYPAGKDIISEEERRIFYVAITRAIKRLFLFSYNQDAQRKDTIPSNYIKELKLFENNPPNNKLSILRKGR